MYRIRSASGAEAVYSSLEDFTAAVRRGEVAPEDEIFHSRANRWLDIKSHPHFRGAVNFSGPLSADTIFPPATPPQAAPPKPRSYQSQAGRPSGGHSHLQATEIPAPPSAPKTVYRPQLAAEATTSSPQPAPAQPSPTPPKAAAAPPAVVKSREIPYIDVGSSKPAPSQAPKVFQAQRPPAAPPPASKEPEFLVMDTGLERPVRASNGHRAVTGDADMLFDTPVDQALPPPQAATAVAPSEPSLQVTPKRPEPLETQTFGSAPATAPKPVIEQRPVPPVTRRAEPVVENLDIPGPPLVDSPLLAVSPAAEPLPTSATRGAVGLVVGSGAVAMLAAGVLIFWRPWSGPVPRLEPPAIPAHSTITGTEEAGETPIPAVTNPAAPPGAASPIHDAASAPAVAPDSTSHAERESVIAATAPSFGSDITAPAADLGLGTDLPAVPAVAAVAPSDLALRLETAEKQAVRDLNSRMSNFQGLLTAASLGSSEELLRTRDAWNSGADAIRQFRARIARLEQAYEDSVLTSQRSARWTGDQMRGWATHQSLAEPAETSQLADLMLSQVAEGLEILASLDGRYQVQGGAIRFDTPSSATRFLSIRSWVDQRVQGWASIPEGARPHTVNLILRALGGGFPPVE